jgi:hypothetical protein
MAEQENFLARKFWARFRKSSDERRARHATTAIKKAPKTGPLEIQGRIARNTIQAQNVTLQGYPSLSGASSAAPRDSVTRLKNRLDRRGDSYVDAK